MLFFNRLRNTDIFGVSDRELLDTKNELINSYCDKCGKKKHYNECKENSLNEHYFELRREVFNEVQRRGFY